MEQFEESVLYFFDALEKFKSELYFDFLEPTIHTIDTELRQSQSNQASVYTVPVVSIEAGLELLKARDMDINLALQNQHPVIMDTGASLVITGDTRDFLPDTYQEVTSLKLGGIAAGASIKGLGDIAWIFQYDNGDLLDCNHNQILLCPKCKD